MDVLEELEPSLDLEPQFRERSNTWPLRPNRVTLEAQNGGSPGSDEACCANGVVVGSSDTAAHVKHEKGAVGDPSGLGLAVKKSGARRNAWGALSYADLITNAIQSSPDKRLTLSQIYDWMVQNVPFFKDKGDSTSSAGWKNSIRHNLSLHSRFMRIQNEGTGKSSWWVINPDAKPGKAPRRRAGSMDTKSGEKKRGRINKKRQEAIRSALENRGSPLNGSIDFLDSLALGDFRSRASSNASSCSRLSPIQPDLHDNQVPSMSPIPWDGEIDVSTSMYQGTTDHFPDLVNSMADSMNLSSQDSMDIGSNLNSDPYLSSGVGQDFNSPQNINGLGDGLTESNQFSHLPAPPPYPERTSPAQTTQQPTQMITPEQPTLSNVTVSNLRRTLLNSLSKSQDLYTDPVSVMNQMNTRNQLSINTQPQTLSTQEGSQQNSPNPQSMASHLSPTINRASPQEKLSPLNRQLSPQQQQQQQGLLGSPDRQVGLSTNTLQQTALQQQQQQQRTKSILRSALTHGSFIFNPPRTTAQYILGLNQSTSGTTTNSSNVNTNLGLSAQQQLQQQQQQPLQQQLQLSSSGSGNSFLGQVSGDTGSSGPVVNNVIMQSSDSNMSNNNLPFDIDMDSSSFMSLPDCDVEQLIKQELSLEGNLDANFDNINPV